MRNTDFTKPQNKKFLSLLERADKLAGSSSVQEDSLGNAHASAGAVAPNGNAHTSVGGAVGAGIGFNDRQKREAFLVSQLPNDFPIDGWENLSTKQQLHAMKYSGLNDQEQWELLNPSTSLNALANYNAQKADAINKAVNSSAIRNSGAFGLNFELSRNSQNPSNPSKLPSLQGMDSDARIRNTNVVEELAAQILGRDRLAPTPNPSATPLPQPGPRIPTQTPNPYTEPSDSNAQNYTWYASYDEAAKAWARSFRQLSKDYEHCALIYKTVDKNGNDLYTFGETKIGKKGIPALGIQPNVIASFLSLYFSEKIPESSLVGFIHSHPEPPKGFTYTGYSDMDLLLKNFPGIDFVTLAAYEKENADPITK